MLITVSRSVRASLAAAIAVMFLFALIPGTGEASKIPFKRKSGSKGQETFVGKIKSIDTAERILVVLTTEGDQEETYEYKKGVRVTSAHKAGEMKISELKAGMLVTLYIKSNKSSSVVYEILVM